MLIFPTACTARLTRAFNSFFGLDKPSNIRFGVGYGITDNLNIGIGRSQLNKTYDGYIKYRILQQDKKVPVSLTVFGSSAIRSEPWPDGFYDDQLLPKHRMSYLSQVLFARKFNKFLSIQLSPTLVHTNLTEEIAEHNTVFALGGAARIQLTPVTSIAIDYFRNFNRPELQTKTVHDALGVGIDFTTPRHAFQLEFTNATGLIGQQFIPNTRSDFFDKGIRFGFHITRWFGL